jgi:hypothetical protein
MGTQEPAAKSAVGAQKINQGIQEKVVRTFFQLARVHCLRWTLFFPMRASRSLRIVHDSLVYRSHRNAEPAAITRCRRTGELANSKSEFSGGFQDVITAVEYVNAPAVLSIAELADHCKKRELSSNEQE